MEAAIYYQPHAGQWPVHRSAARFRIACCGRRFGKTICFAADLIDKAAQVRGDYGWIGPTYQVTERGVDAFRLIASEVLSIKGNSPKVAVLPNESRVFFLSADNPDSARGYGFRGVVIDEAPYLHVDAWNYVIRPTIAQTQGWALVGGTPKGRNYFYDMWTRGRAGEPGYDSFRFPSNANPFFPQTEYDEARRTLPSDVFRQEFEAEFLEDSAGVFRDVDLCLRDEPCVHDEFVVGCDIAKHTDFTVQIAMCRKCGHCRSMERFNQLDWPVQKQRIRDFATRHHGKMVLDSTGIGDPIFDDLRYGGVAVDGYKLTSESKTQLIQSLIVAIEQREISWPSTWTVLTDELRRYEYQYTAAGKLSYNAPAGYHDDCVIALALANHGRKRRAPSIAFA